MNWQEFKRAVEAQGVTDQTVIYRINMEDWAIIAEIKVHLEPFNDTKSAAIETVTL